MAKHQPIFSRSYVEQLEHEVKSGKHLSRYDSEEPSFDDPKMGYIPSVVKPEGLCEKMLSKSDSLFECAKELFKAFPDLTPLQASYEPFWVTLAHTDLFEYVVKKASGEKTPSYIIDHWFVPNSSALHRQELSNLWWTVYMSVYKEEDEMDDPYGLTELMFRNETFRTRVFGPSLVARHREAVIGILEALSQAPEMINEKNGRIIASHFNQLGAVKQLAYLDRTFFNNEMCNLMLHLS